MYRPQKRNSGVLLNDTLIHFWLCLQLYIPKPHQYLVVFTIPKYLVKPRIEQKTKLLKMSKIERKLALRP